VSRRFALLVSPVSAGGKALAAVPEVEAELARLGAEHRTVRTRSREHAAEAAREAAEEGETVVALGGDGLLRPIVSAIRGTASAVALVPCGRGNDFARVLGIPRDPAAAARIAVEGDERQVDVATVDGTPYVGIASLGFDSVANRIANESKLVKGDLVYAYAALRALAGWRPARFTVEVDGERHELTGYTVAIGNSKAYGGGMMLFPQAELDDGQLDVLLGADHSKLSFLLGLPSIFKGTHLDSPHATFLRGREVRVDSEPRFDVYADGDPIARTPATIAVEPRSLRVMVPR
jgi:YegS/Rv2252/BmrU family lipid kinase